MVSVIFSTYVIIEIFYDDIYAAEWLGEVDLKDIYVFKFHKVAGVVVPVNSTMTSAELKHRPLLTDIQPIYWSTNKTLIYT